MAVLLLQKLSISLAVLPYSLFAATRIPTPKTARNRLLNKYHGAPARKLPAINDRIRKPAPKMRAHAIPLNLKSRNTLCIFHLFQNEKAMVLQPTVTIGRPLNDSAARSGRGDAGKVSASLSKKRSGSMLFPYTIIPLVTGRPARAAFREAAAGRPTKCLIF